MVCDHVRAYACGGEPLLALEPWWPLRSPSDSGREQAADPLSLSSLHFSHSLVALITLHVPCPFTLATKGREVKVRPSTGVLRSAYYGSVF